MNRLRARLSGVVVWCALIVGLALVAGGCSDSPGGVFSPKSDIHIVGQTPQTIMPGSTGGTVGGSAGSINAPPLKVYFNITNGVSVFLDTYIVRFYGRNGAPLNGGAFDHSGGLMQQITARPLSTTNTGTGGTGQTASRRGASIPEFESSEEQDRYTGPSVGSLQVEVVTHAMLNHLLSGTSSQLDDVAPVVARVWLRGRDFNEHEIDLVTHVTISNTYRSGN